MKWRLGVILVLLALTACEMLAPSVGITKVVTAKGVQGATFEPIDITDNFAPTDPEFHAIVTLTNAPKDSVVKVVWTAVDVGSAAPPDTKLDEAQITTDGSRNLDFVLKRQGNQWPPGLYKVQTYWNGTLDRTLSFTVVGTPARLGTVVISGCPPATTQAHKPSGWIAQVIIAERVGGNNEPINRTGEFLPVEPVHAIVAVKDAPANTKFRAVFFAVDAGGSTICNVKLGESEQTLGGSGNLDFTVSPPGNWALGKYRVDIYVNGTLDHTANYVVVTQKQVH